MTRRGLPSDRRAVGGAWTPQGQAGLLLWIRSDDTGATLNTTPDPDQFSAIPDRGSVGGSVTQATSANQPQVNSQWGSLRAASFDGADRLSHSAAASAFTATNRGDTNTYLAWVTRLTSLAATISWFGTYNGAASNIGILVQVLTTGVVQYLIGNGSANSTAQSAAGAITTGTTYIMEAEKIGTSMVVRANGTQIATGTLSSPSTSDPLAALMFGARPNGNNGVTGFMPELVGFSGTTLPDRATVRQYLSRWSYTG